MSEKNIIIRLFKIWDNYGIIISQKGGETYATDYSN